jgi:hypothetical protein
MPVENFRFAQIFSRRADFLLIGRTREKMQCANFVSIARKFFRVSLNFLTQAF